MSAVLPPARPATTRAASLAPTGRRERRLRLAHIGWGLGVLACAAVFVAGIPNTFAQLHHPFCNGPSCNEAQLAPPDFRALGGPSAATDAYAVYALAVILAASLVFFAVGGLIAWRKWNEPMALFVSFVLILFGSSGIEDAIGPPVPAAPGVIIILSIILLVVLQYSLLAIFLLTFPTGRFAPRWSALLVPLWIVQVGFYFASAPRFVITVSGFITWGSAAAIQVYRYARLYMPVQRQQTKWVVFSLVLVEVLVRGTYLLAPALWPALNTPGSPYRLARIAADALIWMPISLGVGIAILRSGLYDIDVIIRRTLVYGTLTAILAAVYFGVVIGLQALVGTVNSQASRSPVIIVASTLLIAALFNPLRHRIQATIDRHFYRRKYDAAQTLATFSATLRSELDLAELSERLQEVVEETMQPVHVSLWLRPSPRSDERSETAIGRRGGQVAAAASSALEPGG
jgi:hypothetical protein